MSARIARIFKDAMLPCIVVVSLFLVAANSPAIKAFVSLTLGRMGWHGFAESAPIHAGLHIAGFAAAEWVAAGYRFRVGRERSIALVLITVAILSEIMQSALYANLLEWSDISFDLCGIALGLGCRWLGSEAASFSTKRPEA